MGDREYIVIVGDYIEHPHMIITVDGKDYVYSHMKQELHFLVVHYYLYYKLVK